MPVTHFRPPQDLELARPFWSALESGELRLPRCAACGLWRWYPLETGPHCSGATTEWASLPGTGTVFTYTTVRRPFLPEATLEEVPFVVVLVDLDGADGVRLLGNLAEGVEPRIGMDVVLGPPVGGDANPVFRLNHGHAIA